MLKFVGKYSLALIVFGKISGALAQCALQSGGPLPWSTCTTWSGPTWEEYQGNPLPVTLSIDLNGDGLADLAYVDTVGVHVATSTGSSFTANSATVAGALNCYVGNFDGSHRTGVACLGAGTVSSSTSTGTGFTTLPSQSVPSNNLWNVQSYTNPAGKSYLSNPCVVMDLNGDGRDDIVCGYSAAAMYNNNNGVPTHSATWGVYLSSGKGFTYQTWQGSSGGYTYIPNCLIGDFNGDGLADLACNFSGQTSWNVLLSTGTGWSANTWSSGPSMGYPLPGYCLGQVGSEQANVACTNPCVSGDFDGDGIADIACQEGATAWGIGFGGGNSGFKSVQTWTAKAPSAALRASNYCIVSDIYGTGRSGILCYDSTSNSSSELWTYLASTGSGFSETDFTTPILYNPAALYPDGGTNSLSTVCVAADFNGDGIKDLACHGQTLITNYGATTQWPVALSASPQ